MTELDSKPVKRSMRARIRTSVSRRTETRKRDERGSLLIDSLVAMAMVSIVAAGYMGVNNGVQDAMRHHKSVDQVDQYLTGLAEEASALPWESLANCMRPSPPANAANYTASCPAGAITQIAPEKDIGGGITVNVTTDVTWITSPVPSSPSKFGQKLVTFTASWKPVGGTRRYVTETMTRTAAPTEALPTTIPQES